MNIVLWTLQGALAAMMAMAGGMKSTQSRDKLLENPQMAWVEDYSAQAVRGIGVAELLAAIGLILPWLLDIAPIFTPLAAVGVVIVMIGAALTHRRRGETQAIAMNAIIGVAALVVAIGRFGDL